MSNYIKINGNNILRPNAFTLQREDVAAAEYTTCTGKIVADRIGWKYSDMTMQWDTLPNAQMLILIAMSGESTIIFDDADGSHTEQIERSKNSNTATRFINNDGTVVWKSVSLDVRFINVHND